MTHVFGLLGLALAMFVFLWLCTGCTSDATKTASSSDALDTTDPQLIGMLIGMSGGSIADAATAQFALRRYEEETGRKPAAQDLGSVVGMMQSLGK